MRSLGVDIKPHGRGAYSLISCSYFQNSEINQRANNTVDNPARHTRNMENAGTRGSGGDKDGNTDGRKWMHRRNVQDRCVATHVLMTEDPAGGG